MFLTVSSIFIELMHVSHSLYLLLAVSQCLFQYHGVAACLSLSPMFPGNL